MPDFESKYYTSHDRLRLHYRDYGRRCAPTIICLHGLNRNARDFDTLAPVLASDYRVLSVDFRGRGESDWDPHWRNYVPLTYMGDIHSLISTLDIDSVIIIGTSLGGLVAMLLAAAQPGLVQGVILNDIGPEIDPRGLARIAAYTGNLAPVVNWADALTQVQQVHGHGLDNLDAAGWQQQVQRTFRRDPAGLPQALADPAIGRALRETDMGLGDPWELFAALVDIPTLTLRGEQSDILSPTTVARMRKLKADLVTCEVPDRGHVPLLDEDASLVSILNFLATIK